MITPLQYNIFVLTFGALQAALLGLFLLRKRKNNPALAFLLLYLLTLLIQVVMKIANKIWLMNHGGLFYQFSYLLPFIYGPSLYLFLEQSTKGKPRFPGYLLHYAPFVLAVSVEIMDTNKPLWAYPVVWWGIFLGTIVSLVTYHLLALRLLGHLAPTHNPGAAVRIEWLNKLTTVSFFTTVTLSVTLFMLFVLHPYYSEIRWMFILATVFIYWITYSLLARPELLHSTSDLAQVQDKAALPKYTNSTLDPSEIERILVEVDQLMQQKCLYLDPELTLDDLAELVKTNRHNLSQALNGHLQKKFSDYLNAYRVEAAKSMLTDPKFEYLKIAAIAYKSGFNSLSNFNAVFKKMTGQKPSEFRNI